MAEEEGKDEELKKDTSLSKRKGLSKTAGSSKSSLKKLRESATSTPSETSSTSLTIKRPSDIDKMKGPRYQNTYRLDSKKPFKSEEVYQILESIVSKEIEDFPHYDGMIAPKLIQAIAMEVRNSVKVLNYDRYKICVLVYLGEKKFQGFQAAFRALWDYERDSWTTYYYQCRTYFISCTCFGLYHD